MTNKQKKYYIVEVNIDCGEYTFQQIVKLTTSDNIDSVLDMAARTWFDDDLQQVYIKPPYSCPFNDDLQTSPGKYQEITKQAYDALPDFVYEV